MPRLRKESRNKLWDRMDDLPDGLNDALYAIGNCIGSIQAIEDTAFKSYSGDHGLIGAAEFYRARRAIYDLRDALEHRIWKQIYARKSVIDA